MNWACNKRKTAAVVVVAAAICGCSTGPKGVLWSFATPRPWVLAGDSQALTPAVDGNVAFFCGGYAEKGRSQLYAIDVARGKTQWQYNVGDCGSTPLVFPTSVVCFALSVGNDRILAYGLDKQSGQQKWKIELPGNPHPPPPAAAGNFVFFAPGSRSILRIDARDGSVQSFDIDPDLTVAAENFWVASAAGEAIFGYGTSFWRSQIDSDKLEQGPDLSEPAANPTAVASDGRVLLLGDEAGTMRAFDLMKGNVIWRNRWNKISSAPAIADGKIFLNVYDHQFAIVALALGSGQQLWRVPGGSTYRPYYRDGRVYAAAGTALMAVDSTSGKIEWRVDAPTEVTTTPVPIENFVLFGTVRGVLYAAKTK